MSPAYKSLVKQHYEKKRNEHGLPSLLMYPTTAKLKEQCLIAFEKGFSQKDRKVLVDFFGESEDDNAILKRIKRSRPDDFRPLWNYLNKDINSNPKNIELLAWLTGFEPRPYDHLKNYDPEVLETVVNMPEATQDVEQNKEKKDEQVEQRGENEKPEVEVIEEPVQMSAPAVADKPVIRVDNVDEKALPVALPSNNVKQRTKPKTIIATLAVILLAAVIGIFMYTANGGKSLKNLMGSTLNKEDGCMFWAGDHYQQVPCNQKMGIDTLVIALDEEKLNSFKKITRADTITRNDIGRVWYIKHNNKVEFYTANGNYPLDPTLRLKPITDHIISTYIDTSKQNGYH
jgi:hypothetical protein